MDPSNDNGIQDTVKGLLLPKLNKFKDVGFIL